MNNRDDIIRQIERIKGLKLECPLCEGAFFPQSAKLFSIKEELPEKIKRTYDKMWTGLDERFATVKEERKERRTKKVEKPRRIKATTAGVNFGKIVEKIVPSFQSFPYNIEDCRALYEPIDYIIFNNLAKMNKVDLISFVDVKSGNAVLSTSQKDIRRIVRSGKVNLEVVKDE